MNSKNINLILSQYDRVRSKNRRIESMRKDEIYNAIPQYDQVHREIVQISAERSKALILGHPCISKEDYRAKIQYLSLQKLELLSSNGYSQDYLEPIYDCIDCKDTGFTQPSVKCHCLEQYIFDALLQESTLTKRFSTDSFETFDFDFYQTSDDTEKNEANLKAINTIVNDCISFAKNFDTEYKNILLQGPVGVGKTFLTNCIAQEVLKKNKTIVYFSATEFFQQLAKLTFDNELSYSVKQKLREHVYHSDLLILDDLGTEVNSSLVENQLFTCINERLLLQKPVIFSTNLTLKQIGERYKDRIYSRIAGEYNLYNVPGNDIRIQKKITRMTNMEDR